MLIEAALLRRLACLLFFAFALAGCRAGYDLQAGLGQLELLCGSEDIEDALAREDLDPERMALADNDNDTEYYDLEGRAVTYSVLACPADSLQPYTWSFPIVGTLPYIGFFDRKDADEEAERLQEEGYDTAIYPATAYSTLRRRRDELRALRYWASPPSAGLPSTDALRRFAFVRHGRAPMASTRRPLAGSCP